MNLPNKLTVLRMILVPFFVFFLLAGFIPHNYIIALAIFGIASYTDHLDGKIARRDHLITNFGKFMDPLADKIMVLSALICFATLGHINPWFVLIIMFRELSVDGLRLVASADGKVIAANKWGKAKTVTQIVAIIAVMFFQYLLQLGGTGLFPVGEGLISAFHIIGEIFMAIATLMAVISGVIYFRDNWDAIKEMK